MFALRGRIGRLRYLAYSIVLNILMLIVGGVLVAILMSLSSSNEGLNFVLYTPPIIVSLMMAVRRLNDLNRNGWLCLLFFVPLVNVVGALWLLSASGTHGSNRYGPAPPPNTRATKALAWGGLVVAALLVMVVTIALPAYLEYRISAVIEEIGKPRPVPKN